MIPSSQLLRDASVYSQTTLLTVDILRVDTPIFEDVPVVSGKFSSDRGSKARMSADITIATSNWPELQISHNVHRFRVRRGYQSLGIAETIQHGVFRIDDTSVNDDGTLDISGGGLENYIIDARFLQPRTPVYGVSTVQQIIDLIQEVLPTQVVAVECTQDKPVQATAPWARERWDAIDALAGSINAEVFADYRGYFVIRDIPTFSGGTPVYSIVEGPGGTLSSRKLKNTRDKVYNAVSASGQSSDPDVPPVWGWAADLDPLSPTYYYGDFGQVPRFFSSQFFTTNEQCVATAQNMLDDALAANQSLSLTALPLTFLEVGDLITVQIGTGELQRRLIEKISFDLGYDAAVSIDTLALKDLTAEEA